MQGISYLSLQKGERPESIALDLPADTVLWPKRVASFFAEAQRRVCIDKTGLRSTFNAYPLKAITRADINAGFGSRNRRVKSKLVEFVLRIMLGLLRLCADDQGADENRE